MWSASSSSGRHFLVIVTGLFFLRWQGCLLMAETLHVLNSNNEIGVKQTKDVHNPRTRAFVTRYDVPLGSDMSGLEWPNH